MSHIKAVGFEIEGGWAGEPGVPPFTDADLIDDGSINGTSLNSAKPIRAPHVGEVVSKPLDFATDDWRKWLTDHWPNAEPKDRTNRTCGFHIHTSFHRLDDYVKLTSKGFLYGLCDVLGATGKRLKLPAKHIFWERLEGANRFCRLEFDADAQLQLQRGNHHGHNERYGLLNFAYNVHGTVEFRALPTFRDSKVAIRFAEDYFTYLDQYLDELQHVKVAYSATLVA